MPNLNLIKMKNQRVRSFILSFVLLISLHGLLVAGNRALAWWVPEGQPAVYTALFGIKAMMFLLMTAFGLLLYGLMRRYRAKGFLGESSVRWVQVMGGLAVVLGLFNSGSNVLEQELLARNRWLGWGDWTRKFLADFLFESPFYLLFGLLLLLFADVIARALAVKNENESFI